MEGHRVRRTRTTCVATANAAVSASIISTCVPIGPERTSPSVRPRAWPSRSRRRAGPHRRTARRGSEHRQSQGGLGGVAHRRRGEQSEGEPGDGVEQENGPHGERLARLERREPSEPAERQQHHRVRWPRADPGRAGRPIGDVERPRQRRRPVVVGARHRSGADHVRLVAPVAATVMGLTRRRDRGRAAWAQGRSALGRSWRDESLVTWCRSTSVDALSVGATGGGAHPPHGMKYSARIWARSVPELGISAPRSLDETLRAQRGPFDQARSKRSRFITLSHAATKSRTNFSFASSHA